MMVSQKLGVSILRVRWRCVIDFYQACFLTFFMHIHMKKRSVAAAPDVILFSLLRMREYYTWQSLHVGMTCRIWCADLAYRYIQSALQFALGFDEKWKKRGVYVKNALFSAENKDVLKYWGEYI